MDHPAYLDNFIEKGKMNIVKVEERFLIGKNKSGFIFPFKVNIRLETNSNDDIGASGLVMPFTDNLDYLLINKFGIL